MHSYATPSDGDATHPGIWRNGTEAARQDFLRRVRQMTGPELRTLSADLRAKRQEVAEELQIVSEELLVQRARYHRWNAAHPPVAPDGAPTALIVDDNVAAACLLGRHLTRLGITCRCAYWVADALVMIRDCRPCLLVLDVSMPDATGIDLLRTVRAHPDNAGIHAVFYTGEDGDHHGYRDEAHRLGAHWMVKGTMLDELASFVLARCRPA